MSLPIRRTDCDVLVIGSGPGGALTGLMLAEAGIDVLLIEEGVFVAPNFYPPYSADEIEAKYRHVGVNPAWGSDRLNFIEARCLGGASEINSALHHRPLEEIVRGWIANYRIKDLNYDNLLHHCEIIENDLHVTNYPGEIDSISAKLRLGARELGWQSEEIPRWWRYEANGEGGRQSMTKTYLPRGRVAGLRVKPGIRCHRLHVGQGRAKFAEVFSNQENGIKTEQIYFKHLFLCAGAVQTPAILRRSGIKNGPGDHLSMHPMARMVARFKEPINPGGLGVPVEQVTSFKPGLTLGCSNSDKELLGLWLADCVEPLDSILQNWSTMAVFYALIYPRCTGRIRCLPISGRALAYYELLQEDRILLCEGLERLGKLLFAAGAIELRPPILQMPIVRNISELKRALDGSRLETNAIHVFSSCPMGEAPFCPVASHGELKEFSNIYLNDASILPTATGVNPQATIMSLARRNVTRFLDRI